MLDAEFTRANAIANEYRSGAAKFQRETLEPYLRGVF